MTLEKLLHMVKRLAEQGQTPRTILMTTADAAKMGLPKWTAQLWGLKVVIADNLLETKVVPHIYESVKMKTPMKEEEINEKLGDYNGNHYTH